MTVKKALLIVNPNSGNKNGTHVARYVAERLSQMHFDCIVHMADSVNDMHQFVAKTSINNFDLIGIIGGDGTMHEFINAVLRKYETLTIPVALFPCGTGNAFNFDIGCATADATLSCIEKQSTSWIDVAEVHYGDDTFWSFNIIGCGLVADINALAEKMRWLGSSRYTIASLIKLLVNRTIYARISTDEGDFEGDISFVLACNTRYTGKGMMMAPLAKLHDGKFDILIVKACSRFTLLRLFPKIFKGGHLGSNSLQYIQTKTLRVECKHAECTNIDGEMKGTSPFHFEVRREKINVFMS
jgi:YegS/Rv2252/BmrU family lipid kinase